MKSRLENLLAAASITQGPLTHSRGHHAPASTLEGGLLGSPSSAPGASLVTWEARWIDQEEGDTQVPAICDAQKDEFSRDNSDPGEVLWSHPAGQRLRRGKARERGEEGHDRHGGDSTLYWESGRLGFQA